MLRDFRENETKKKMDASKPIRKQREQQHD
jgi:hypothetical protein